MCTPEQKITPDEPLTDNPTSDEIADMVLRGEIDMSGWRASTDSELAEAFTDLVGAYVSFEYSEALEPMENRSELLSAIVRSIHASVKYLAEKEAGDIEGGMSTLL